MIVAAAAKVWSDGSLMKRTSSERVFNTPPLPTGTDYFYTVRVVAERDGKPNEEVRRVVVRAGGSAHLAFGSPAPSTGDGRALASKP